MEKRYTRSEVKELMEKLLFDAFGAGRGKWDGIDEWFEANVPKDNKIEEFKKEWEKMMQGVNLNDFKVVPKIEGLDFLDRLDKFEERLRRLEMKDIPIGMIDRVKFPELKEEKDPDYLPRR